MKAINIHEPVWNGGNPYLSVKTDRISKGSNFVESDYKNKHGERTFPHIYYLPSSYCKEVHNERWGEAYHIYLNDLETVRFWFTIAWDGENEGEFTSNRPTYEYMVAGIKEYLNKWSKRSAYLECCSLETAKKTHYVDLTSYVKEKLSA